MKRFKAVMLLGVCGLLLIAALVLLLVNLDSDWRLKFFVKDMVGLHRAGVLLAASLYGIVTWLVCRACLPAGLRAWRQVKKADKQNASIHKAVQQAAEKSRPSPGE